MTFEKDSTEDLNDPFKTPETKYHPKKNLHYKTEIALKTILEDSSILSNENHYNLNNK